MAETSSTSIDEAAKERITAIVDNLAAEAFTSWNAEQAHPRANLRRHVGRRVQERICEIETKDEVLSLITDLLRTYADKRNLVSWQQEAVRNLWLTQVGPSATPPTPLHQLASQWLTQVVWEKTNELNRRQMRPTMAAAS